MSSLQLSLAIAGGLVLAGVVVHGAWQARRSEIKRVADEPPAPQEPSFDTASSNSSRGAVGSSVTREALRARLRISCAKAWPSVE